MLPMIVFLSSSVTYNYGDVREFTSRIPESVLEQNPNLGPQLSYLQSVIEGALVLEFNDRREAVGFVEINVNAIAPPSA